MSIDREVAEKVMGWHKWNDDPLKIVWFDGKEPAGFTSLNDADDCWQPSTRIDHAIMCLEKFPIWKITKFPDSNYECVIGVGKGYIGGAIDTELAKTICLAALEAVKEKENGNTE